MGVSPSKRKVILPFASALQTMRLCALSMGVTRRSLGILAPGGVREVS